MFAGFGEITGKELGFPEYRIGFETGYSLVDRGKVLQNIFQRPDQVGGSAGITDPLVDYLACIIG
jgi:hypothetical protein